MIKCHKRQAKALRQPSVPDLKQQKARSFHAQSFSDKSRLRDQAGSQDARPNRDSRSQKHASKPSKGCHLAVLAEVMKVNLSLMRSHPQDLPPGHRVQRAQLGGAGGGSSKDSSSNSECGSDSSQSDDLYRKEKRLMRVKAYETFKVLALPKNAAEATGFRNQLCSNITKLAKGDEAPVLQMDR